MKKVSINTTNGGTFKDIKSINHAKTDTVNRIEDVMAIIASKDVWVKDTILVEGELDNKPYTACIPIFAALLLWIIDKRRRSL